RVGQVVYGVERAVDEPGARPLNGRAGALAVEHRLLDTLVDRRTEALRNDAADDLVDELVALVAVERLEDDYAIAELAAAAGLLLVAALRARFLPDRLEVRHARLGQVDLDVEPVLQAPDGGLAVHLREPAQQLLAGLRVAPHLDRRILLAETAEAGGHLLLVALRLRSDGEAHHRLGEADLRQLDVSLGVEEHVAGLRLLQLPDGADFALAKLPNLRGVLPLPLQQPAD